MNGKTPKPNGQERSAMSITSAPGEKDLNTLLSTLTTHLHGEIYVFVTIPHSQPIPANILASSATIMTFREKEGLTIITTIQLAEEYGLKYVFRSRMITLEVQSSLEAVGFMAVVTKALAGKGIGCNPISAYFHDHLLVPEEKAKDAIAMLREVAENAKRED